MLNILIQKTKDRIKKTSSQIKDADGKAIWSVDIKLDGAKKGYGIGKNMKDATQLASLNFFKSVFPPSTTWNGAVKIVRESTNPLPSS